MLIRENKNTNANSIWEPINQIFTVFNQSYRKIEYLYMSFIKYVLF